MGTDTGKTTPNSPAAQNTGTPAAGSQNTPGEDKTAEFAERERALSEREQAIAEREREIARRALTAEFEEHATAGRIRPADVPALVEFATLLDGNEKSIEYGEGDEAKQQTPREFLSDFIGRLPKAIEYGEVSGGGADTGEAMDSDTVVDRARAYVKKVKEESGRTVSFTEAVNTVRAGRDQ